MRRLLAIGLLAFFASLNVMDAVCCPDGCTNEQSPSAQHHPNSTDGICMLCLGGVDSPVRPELGSCIIVTDRVRHPPLAHYLDASSDPLEHPPRS